MAQGGGTPLCAHLRGEKLGLGRPNAVVSRKSRSNFMKEHAPKKEGRKGRSLQADLKGKKGVKGGLGADFEPEGGRSFMIYFG